MVDRGTDAFRIGPVHADPATGNVALHYRFDGGGEFVERINLPPLDSASLGSASQREFDAAAKLLLLVAGTSYYKTRAPTTLIVDVPTTAAERRLVQQLYDHGMREFAYVNQLPIPLVTRIDFRNDRLPDRAPTTGGSGGTVGSPLVPFGGGKDSTVVLSLLPEGRPLTVNPTSTHAVVADVLGHELITVHRVVDRIDELTSPDRLNGHIPITAIVSAIALLVAVRDGFTSVVLANEAAASEPTLVSDRPGSVGAAVNHQWSKGAAFEALFDAAATAAGISVRYFSWLRDVEEPDIIRLLAAEPDALGSIVSCNRAFAGRTAGAVDEAPQRWCGQCPKCLFTFLMLATRIGPDELVEIFGADLLGDSSRRLGFAELWSEVKPLECVGERTDAAGALLQLVADPRWAGRPLIDELAPSARAALALGRWEPIGADEAGDDPRPAPPAFTARLQDALAGSGS